MVVFVCVLLTTQYDRDDASSTYRTAVKQHEADSFVPSQLPDCDTTLPLELTVPYVHHNQANNNNSSGIIPRSLVDIVYHGVRSIRISPNIDAFELTIPSAAYTTIIADTLDVNVNVLSVPVDESHKTVDRIEHDKVIQVCVCVCV